MAIRKLLKSLPEVGDKTKLAEFEDTDTISSSIVSNDPTNKIYTTGTNISDTIDNIDSEISRINEVRGVAKPLFSAYRSGAIFWNLNGTTRITTTMIYENQKFDLTQNYDTQTGRFTAPVTGLYNFTTMHSIADFDIQTAYEHYAMLYKNGVLFRHMFSQTEEEGDTNDLLICKLGEVQVHLTQNDYVDVRVTVGGGGTASDIWNRNSQVGDKYTWFHGYLINED